MNIPEENLIKIPLKGIAKKLNPSVFRNGGSVCVLYGTDPQHGIFGCGNSVEEALDDWDTNLRKAVSSDIDIKRIIANIDPPEDVKNFLNEYQLRAKNDDTAYRLNKNY
ncbi:hypothetical protein ASE74_15905 [Pedobacter sp. Leaf216]|uniref:hypothetical protein n=1 Tax=Pedobacter sp. Leaf216 TaxID=1735684 RepID=UPI0006FA7ECF|nr:hypothetical protein [Pedobacter sp. Leaf216]KQM77883.1 hypothetical protein ASE74_15905 [Pedobacter sp. Leaf216]